MLNIVLFGPPGAGKGLQAKNIAEKYGLRHLSTGELIREEIANGSPLGKSMEDYIARGQLAPDQLVLDMVSDYLTHHPDIEGTIFDGFPRTIVQAEKFDHILKEHGTSVAVMLALEVPDDVAVERIILRGERDGRADDLSEATIRNRLHIYSDVTAPVAGHYQKQGKFVPIDGLGTIDEIFGRLSSEIDKHR